jgi:hypothetical protein
MNSTITSTQETTGFVLGKKFLLDSVKAMGMTIESSISELIDNSIDANATEVIIRKEKQEVSNESAPVMFTFTIQDNGKGMSYEKLTECIATFGYHENYELGAISHYGVGLKIALLYLCNGGEITLVTRHEGQLSEARISTSKNTPEGQEIVFSTPTSTTQPNGTTIIIPNVVDNNNNSALLKFLGATYYPKWYNDNNFRIVLWNQNDEEHPVIFTDPMYRHLVDVSNKVTRMSYEFNVGDSLIGMHGYILDEDRFVDSDYTSYDKRKETSNGKKLVLNRAGIYLRLGNRYITLGNGYFPGYVPQHYYNGCRIEVEVPKDCFTAFGIQINKSKCEIDIQKPELRNFTSYYKNITGELQRKLKKNTSNKSEVEKNRIKDDGVKLNGFLKKGRLKNPLENPKIKDLVPETKRDVKEPQSTKNRPDGLTYVKNHEVIRYDELNMGERDFFYFVERQGTITVLIVNKDHPWYQKFIEMEQEGRYLILTTLFSQYYSVLEILTNNDMFDPTTYNIVLDDFWRNQTDYLRRIYAL